MPKTCFVICPIGEDGSETRRRADDFLKYIVEPCQALKEFDYAPPIRADHIAEPGRITTQIVKCLFNAELVIADLTDNNANVIYELSYRHALGKPAIHLALEGRTISFDLRDNRAISYSMHARSAEAAREQLSAQIRRVHEPDYKPSNPIVDAMGILDLQRSTDPKDHALGDVMVLLSRMYEDIITIRGQTARAYANEALIALLKAPPPPSPDLSGLSGLPIIRGGGAFPRGAP